MTRRAAGAFTLLLAASACTGAPPAAPGTVSSSTASSSPSAAATPSPSLRAPTLGSFAVPAGSHPHDVAPAPDGRVWYTAQRSGELGLLDPRTGRVERVPLGTGSAPHGVIVGPDGSAWVTDGGLNAIVRVDGRTHAVRRFAVPRDDANLNTAAFDGRGVLWFTGQSGIYGSVEPVSGKVRVFDAPRGRGPYGIAVTPDGTVWFSSLAGSYIARISADGALRRFDVPTPGGGARRVWSDSSGMLWVTEWNAGKLARFDPASSAWKEWRLPGSGAQPYAVFVDDRDVVWVTDFGANAIQRFDPVAERFTTLRLARPDAAVRQLLGRAGEVWGAESGTDHLVVVRT